MRQLLIAAALCAAAAAWFVASVPDMLEDTRKPPSAPTVPKLERAVKNLEGQVAAMEQTADRYAKWKTCVRLVPVNEVGDPDNTFGYAYDERDGTGKTFMPALAVDPEDERPEYAFPQVRPPRRLPQPADPARRDRRGRLGRHAGHRARVVDRLERARAREEGRAARREEGSPRADGRGASTSGSRASRGCLSPSTATLTTASATSTARRGQSRATGPAIAVDNSERDDPDYEFLAFVGRDRPFTGPRVRGRAGRRRRLRPAEPPNGKDRQCASSSFSF
jgi:hypothetical protein